MAQSYQHDVPRGNEPHDDLPVVVEGRFRFRFRRRLLKSIVGVTVGCVFLMAIFAATRNDMVVSILASPSMRTARVADHPDLPKYIEEDMEELKKY